MKTNDILKQEWDSLSFPYYDPIVFVNGVDYEVEQPYCEKHLLTRHNFTSGISDEAMDKKLLDIIDEEIETNNTLPLGQYNAAMHALILLKKRLTNSTNEQTT